MKECDVWQRRSLAMELGITGLRQEEVRHEADLDRWVERDRQCIEWRSLLLDVQILARTRPAVTQGEP